MTAPAELDPAGTAAAGGHALRAAAYVALANALVAAIGLGWHLLVARRVGPAGYAPVGLLITLLALLSVPAAAEALQAAAAATGRCAEGLALTGGAEEVVFLPANRRLLWTGAALLIAAGPLLTSLCGGTWVAPAVLVLAWPITVTAFRLRGWHWAHGPAGVARAAWVSVAGAGMRVGLGWSLMLAGWAAVSATIVGFTAGEVLVTLALSCCAGHPPRVPKSFAGARTAAPLPALAVLLSQVLFWLVAYVDEPIAQGLLPSAAAGRYIAADVLGRAVLFVPQALVTVQLGVLLGPDRAAAHRALRTLLRVLGVAGIVAVATLTGAAPTVLKLLGPGFGSASGALIALCAGSVFLAGLTAITFVALVEPAAVRRGLLWLLAVGAGTVAGAVAVVSAAGASAAEVARVDLAVVAAISVLAAVRVGVFAPTLEVAAG